MSKTATLVADLPEKAGLLFEASGEHDPDEIVKEYVGFGDADDALGEAFFMLLKEYEDWERNNGR